MITTSFNSGAGQIELNIITAHSSVATVSQIGQLRYRFDQTPDQLSIDRVQALYTYMNVDLLQYDDGGHDLWSVLLNETNEATLQATLEVVLPDGAFQFLFKLRKSDISLNEKSGLITLRLTPYTNFNTRMGTLIDSMYTAGVDSRDFRTSYTNEERETSNYRYTCVSPKDFIDYALSNVFGNGYDNIIKPSLTGLDDTFSEEIYDTFQPNKNQFVLADVRTTGAPSGTDMVAPAESDGDTEIGVGTISGFSLLVSPTWGQRTYLLNISEAGGVGLGDVIYLGDSSTVLAGRRLGPVIKMPTSSPNFGKYEIKPDINDVTSVPTGSYPYKIERAKRPENNLVIDTLKDLAGIEGSIFGTGFSKNFFINRLREEGAGENLVTINYNEAIDFRPFNFDLGLGRSNVDQIAEYRQLTAEFFGQWGLVVPARVTEDNPQRGSGVPNLGSFSSITRGNEGASKGLDIKLAPAYPHLNKGRTSFEVEGRNLLDSKSLEAALTRNGLKSYFQSLNSTKDSIAVEFTVIGSQRVLPYELFQFDSRAPERYRDKQFRITEVSYDFVSDTCKVKGYQISSVTTPVVDDPRPRVPPPRTPPAFVGDPIGVLIRGVNDETVDSLSIDFYSPITTGSSILIVNDLEREQGYFQDKDAGQYEVTINNGDVGNNSDDDFVGTNILDINKGSAFTQVFVRATSVMELTAGSSITITNISGRSQVLTVATTVTTIASKIWPSGGANTTIQVNEATADHFYQGSYSYVHKAGYTPAPKSTTYPAGISEIPIQSSRINAPKGSFVYLSAPFEKEGITIYQHFTNVIQLKLFDPDTGLEATSNSLIRLDSNVSNINGVVTAQGSFIVSLDSKVTNIDSDVVAQSTAITGLNTRVTAGEGYLISNASAITNIESRIDDPDSGLNASASAIDILKTNVSSIDGTLTAQAEKIEVIEVNVTTLDGNFSAISSDVSNVSIEVDEVTGKVSNISAKRAIVVGAGGKLARISLSANDGNGTAGSSEINISADQVKIQNIIFEDTNSVIRSGDFVADTTGFRLRGNDGTGKSDAEFDIVKIRRGVITASNFSGNVVAESFKAELPSAPVAIFMENRGLSFLFNGEKHVKTYYYKLNIPASTYDVAFHEVKYVNRSVLTKMTIIVRQPDGGGLFAKESEGVFRTGGSGEILSTGQLGGSSKTASLSYTEPGPELGTSGITGGFEYYFDNPSTKAVAMTIKIEEITVQS